MADAETPMVAAEAAAPAEEVRLRDDEPFASERPLGAAVTERPRETEAGADTGNAEPPLAPADTVLAGEKETAAAHDEREGEREREGEGERGGPHDDQHTRHDESSSNNDGWVLQGGDVPTGQVHSADGGDRHLGAPLDDTVLDEGKMFIGGLNWETTQEGLAKYFSAYGNVADAMVMRDPHTGRSRGFGFVRFSDPASVDKVIAAKPHTLDHRMIEPKRAVPRTPAAPATAAPSERTKKIFVGGISQQTTEDGLRSYFARFGEVTEAVLMLDRDTRRPRGFGFVSFTSEDAADRVCETAFHEIDGKNVEVKKAQPVGVAPRPTSRYPGARDDYRRDSRDHRDVRDSYGRAEYGRGAPRDVRDRDYRDYRDSRDQRDGRGYGSYRDSRDSYGASAYGAGSYGSGGGSGAYGGSYGAYGGSGSAGYGGSGSAGYGGSGSAGYGGSAGYSAYNYGAPTAATAGSGGSYGASTYGASAYGAYGAAPQSAGYASSYGRGAAPAGAPSRTVGYDPEESRYGAYSAAYNAPASTAAPAPAAPAYGGYYGAASYGAAQVPTQAQPPAQAATGATSYGAYDYTRGAGQAASAYVPSDPQNSLYVGAGYGTASSAYGPVRSHDSTTRTSYHPYGR